MQTEYKTIYMIQLDLAKLIGVTKKTVSNWTCRGWLTAPKRVGPRAVYDLRITC